MTASTLREYRCIFANAHRASFEGCFERKSPVKKLRTTVLNSTIWRMNTPLVAGCRTNTPKAPFLFWQRWIVFGAGLVVLLGAGGCETESPADGFTLFLEAVQNHRTQETFARLSPESREEVELSLAKYVMEHPEKHMPPAEYLFHGGELDRLKIGLKKMNVLVVKGLWAQLSVETIEGDTLLVVMQKVGKKWTFHLAPSPSFLSIGES
ncbi:MAG: hypothetical protein GY822_08625 [Deltaproteobacteria bacterium]|nr:hypothetical protein [Deltaproteobacteria bacterium]